MTVPKSKQVMPVICPNPPIPATVLLRRLEIAYTKKCDELERAQKAIQILQAKLHQAQGKHK